MNTSAGTLTLVTEYTGSNKGTLTYTFEDSGCYLLFLTTCYVGNTYRQISYDVSTERGSIETDWVMGTDYTGNGWYAKSWAQIARFDITAGETLILTPDYQTGGDRSYKIYKVN